MSNINQQPLAETMKGCHLRQMEGISSSRQSGWQQKVYLGSKNVGSVSPEHMTNRFTEASGMGVGFRHVQNILFKRGALLCEAIVFMTLRGGASAKCNSGHSSEALPHLYCASLWEALGPGVRTMRSLSESLRWNQSVQCFSSTPQKTMEIMYSAINQFKPAGHETPVCAAQ